MIKKFVKMHGLGNHFLLMEPEYFGLSNLRTYKNTFNVSEFEALKPKVFEICRPIFGVGAEGVLLMSQIENRQYKMSIFNGADLTMSLMCGNGLRCAAAYLSVTKKLGRSFTVATDSGDMIVEVDRMSQNLFNVKSNLGELPNYRIYNSVLPISQKEGKYLQGVTPYFCQVGDPQIVLFLSPEQFSAIRQANAYDHIYALLTDRQNINVSFCQVINRSTLKIFTYEFGNGVTLACGTGSTASTFVGNQLNLLDSKVTVQHLTGNLIIEIARRQNGRYEGLMSGPAEYVFTGYANGSFI